MRATEASLEREDCEMMPHDSTDDAETLSVIEFQMLVAAIGKARLSLVYSLKGGMAR